MKISLFCVFGLICLAGSHPTNQKSNPVIENEHDELELLQRQKRQQTSVDGQDLNEEEKRKPEQEQEIEEEEEEEEEENDTENQEEQEERKGKAVEEEEEEFTEQKNDKSVNGQNLNEEEKRKPEQEQEIEEEEEEEEENDTENQEEQEERKGKAVEEEEEEFTEKKNDKSVNGQNLNEEEQEIEEEEEEENDMYNQEEQEERNGKAVDEEEEEEIFVQKNDTIVDPDNPLSNLYEGMIIEQDGQQHRVKGLHPERSSKTYGNTHGTQRLLPEQQRDMANGKRVKRNFITDTSKFWHKSVIPYKFINMSSNSITVINKAIQQYIDTTCVRWVPENTAGSYGLNHQNVVHFVHQQGCWSYVGNVGQDMNPTNVQKISLEEPGCISVATIVHEMLHAIGARHEQSRSDRDNYVEIGWDNLEGGITNINMKKHSTQNNNPYDAESTMQYSLYAFSTNGLRTILFKDQRLEFLADSADGLEFYDIQDVNDAYHCADHCTNSPACQNGGFVNFQCVCVCPDGLTGATCTDTVSNSPTCGGVVTLGQGEEKFIQSPNYPSNYPTGLECTWLIKGTNGNLVRATVEYMDIAAGPVCYHWLEYRYNLLGQKGPKRCGTNFNAGEEIWDSTSDELGNEMIIKFNSNKNSNKAGAKGFRLKVQSIGTGCEAKPCVYGKCLSAERTSTYTCTCNSGVSGQNCDVLNAV